MRRTVRFAATALLTAAMAGAAGGCSSGTAHAPADTVGSRPFTTRVAAPPLAPSRVDANGVRTFQLRAQPGEHTFRPGTTTPTMGYNGSYLGPTLRATRGEQVRVHVDNALDTTTTVHWHGMHVPAAFDGGPHQPIAPGGVWNPSWQIRQPAASLWYHPHPDGATEGQVAAGLAGMFIVDDRQEDALRLPHAYGVDDVPLIVQDFQLDDRGNRGNHRSGQLGTLGNAVAVNGVSGGYFDVTTQLVRLRLLNASTARTYNFTLSDGRPMRQIASDAGLLAAAHTTTSVLLSPGERTEVVVAFAPGERVVLRSELYDIGTRSQAEQLGENDRFDLLQLRAAATLARSNPIPDRLATIDRLNPADATKQRSFEFEGTEINDRHMDMNRIDQTITLGATEIWTVRNGNGNRPHSFHLHDEPFQVLDIDGAPPPPELAGWKDTILLRPDHTYRLIMRFTDYADPTMPYMYHCHMLWHEDRGMMGQFVVVQPGQLPAPRPAHHM